jgi:predicted DNA-binding protein
MVRKIINLTDQQAKRLKGLSQKTGAPQTELVRRAIEAYLKQHRA